MKLLCSVLTFILALPLQASVYSGRVSCDGRGVSEVSVTDGLTVVKTDAEGRFSLESTDAEFIYISRPTGYELPQRNFAQCFYRSVTDCNFDFELVRSDANETEAVFFLWADTQVYEEKELDYIRQAAEDMAEYVRSSGNPAAFALSCGDIIGDIKSEPELFLPVAHAASNGGVPFFYAIGNHDVNMKRSENSAETRFHELFGPTYYSFDIGMVHFVVLDNVDLTSLPYRGAISERQLQWLRNDLSYVAPGSTVMVCMHIPAYSRDYVEGRDDSYKPGKITVNRDELREVLAPYNAHILSAHEHYADNYVISENLMEHVHAPLSGLFWQSLLSCDGLPWGYYVYKITGSEISWTYKPVGMSDSVSFSATRDDDLKPGALVVNVWNWDPAWKVLWYENGEPRGEMTRYTGYDSFIRKDVDLRREDEFKWKYIGAGATSHLFYAYPQNEDAKVRIEVTDRFGRVWEQEM